jgi:lipoprotein-anchoring transpeptidase ErfK/SrfK
VSAALLSGVVVAACVGFAVGRGGAGGSTPATQSAAALVRLPAPVAPAFRPPEPRLLSEHASRTAWAPVVHPVVVRARPNLGAAAVAELDARTPEGTVNAVLRLNRPVRDRRGRLWVHARISGLPGRNTGWVPRHALGGYTVVDTRLVVDLERYTATLYRAGRPVFRAEVGVGTANAPTPRGNFFVRNELTAYASAFYGPVAFGTSARSPVLTDWPAGGFIGIHGTDRPDLLPGRVSHGCIRMRNQDILRLARLMPVGTPLTIR